MFGNAAGALWRPRAERMRELLTAADMPDEFTLPGGDEKVNYTWHATRRTFASLLSDAAAPGEAIDYLLGHQPPTTRGRHYTAPPMNELARVVALLALALPARAGVSSSGESLSQPLSQPEKEPEPSDEKESKKHDLGGVAERSKAAVLKTAVPVTVPGVRIPSPPQPDDVRITGRHRESPARPRGSRRNRTVCEGTSRTPSSACTRPTRASH